MLVCVAACAGPEHAPADTDEDPRAETDASDSIDTDGDGSEDTEGPDSATDTSGPDADSDTPFDADEEIMLRIASPRLREPVDRAVVIEVDVTPSDRASVSFFVDEELVGVDRGAPFNAVWISDAAAEGEHLIEVHAERGDRTAEASTLVVVDHTPPLLTFRSPGPDSPGPANGILPVEIVAFDESGISWVDVSIEGVNDGLPTRLTEEPFVHDFDVAELGVGEHFVDVRARDEVGLEATARAAFIGCDVSLVACDEACRPPEFFVDSFQNCGACGRSCEVGAENCVDSNCVCADGLELCEDGCRSLDTDPENCGRCGTSCTSAESCVLGECTRGPLGMAVIAPGTFLMGSPEADPSHVDAETQHRVTITRAYAIDRTEVTHAEWESYFPINPSEAWSCGSSCPVESVTFWDALAAANARSERDGLSPCYELVDCNDLEPGNGLECAAMSITASTGSPLDCDGYRLPTEAEWEYAYRAGTTSPTYAGDIGATPCTEEMHLMEIAWYHCNSEGTPHRVGNLAPNGFGLYDMAGNVFEWTGDGWRSDVPGTAETDPWIENGRSERAFKGGGWNEVSVRIRAASRLSAAMDFRLPYLGFRLVRSAPEGGW